MSLLDSHCHLDADEFGGDRLTVLERARSAGVENLVVPAVSAAGWAGLARLCAKQSGLHPAYGLHPMYLADHLTQHLDDLEEFLDQHPAAAVGEAGLDFYLSNLDPDSQRHYFHAQLAIARERDLPIILHARRAHEEVLHAVRRYQPLRGVIHSYAGSLEQARQFIDLGFMLGFGGPITYPRAARLQQLIRDLPLDSILAETDAPDQPLHGHQGQRNEPALLPLVIAKMAELRGISADEVATATTANGRRMFSLEARVPGASTSSQ